MFRAQKYLKIRFFYIRIYKIKLDCTSKAAINMEEKSNKNKSQNHLKKEDKIIIAKLTRFFKFKQIIIYRERLF